MTVADLHIMDANAVRFCGLSSEIPGGQSDLPTTNIPNCSTFYVLDTGVTYMFYLGTWYELV